MIDIEKTILEKSPEFKSKLGGKQFISFLKKLRHEQEINEFIKKNQHFKGFYLLDKVLEHFDFSYQVDNKSLDNIPEYGVKVPTLFKQYSELREEDGCHFIDFSVDPNFNNCIDCLILVEIDKIKEI